MAMMSSTFPLGPCGFCGGKDTFECALVEDYEPSTETVARWYDGACTACGHHTRTTDGELTSSGLFEAWGGKRGYAVGICPAETDPVQLAKRAGWTKARLLIPEEVETPELEGIINTPVAERKRVMPALVCADGLRLSVQASCDHYCTPRDNEGPWVEVEVWASEMEPLLAPFLENPEDPDSVCGYVPIDVVREIISRHGGLV